MTNKRITLKWKEMINVDMPKFGPITEEICEEQRKRNLINWDDYEKKYQKWRDDELKNPLP